MACQVQNQYPCYDRSFLATQQHHELVLKKLSALSVRIDSTQAEAPSERREENEAARDWYGEAKFSCGQFGRPGFSCGQFSCGQFGGQSENGNAPQVARSSALPINPPPPSQFIPAPLSSSAPSSNFFAQSPPQGGFSSGWHEGGGKQKESLAASAARFYEQKRRASMAAHRSPRSFDSALIHGGSPLSRSSPPEEFGFSRGVGRKSPPGSFQEGGFFFAPRGVKLSPTSSLSSALSADSNPVSPAGTDSDHSGQSSSMEGASKPLARNWEMEAESVLARAESCGEDKLAPLVGRGLRRGLSRHYGGKSRSFTCLADVVTSPIQHLAKPENPYAKRRKNNNGSHSNLLGRASGNFSPSPLDTKSLGFEDTRMNEVLEAAEEGGDVATALRPLGRSQPLRSQSLADLRAIGRRRLSPEH